MYPLAIQNGIHFFITLNGQKCIHLLLLYLETHTLQTRIIHRILGTKSLLYKMNIVNDNLCCFCKDMKKPYYTYSRTVFLPREL